MGASSHINSRPGVTLYYLIAHEDELGTGAKLNAIELFQAYAQHLNVFCPLAKEVSLLAMLQEERNTIRSSVAEFGSVSPCAEAGLLERNTLIPCIEKLASFDSFARFAKEEREKYYQGCVPNEIIRMIGNYVVGHALPLKLHATLR